VSEVFLGIIAAAVLVMALIQVGLIVMAVRAASRVGALVERLDADLRPVIANLQSISAEAARATAIASAQVERADRMFTDMATRLDETLATVHGAVRGVTHGSAWVSALKTLFNAVRDMRAPSRRASTVDEEDALFIG
jgi:hypothetical protein